MPDKINSCLGSLVEFTSPASKSKGILQEGHSPKPGLGLFAPAKASFGVLVLGFTQRGATPARVPPSCCGLHAVTSPGATALLGQSLGVWWSKPFGDLICLLDALFECLLDASLDNPGLSCPDVDVSSLRVSGFWGNTPQ